MALKCRIEGCERKAGCGFVTCRAHELRLQRGWTLEETTLIPLRPRGRSQRELTLRAAIRVVKRLGYMDAVEEITGLMQRRK